MLFLAEDVADLSLGHNWMSMAITESRVDAMCGLGIVVGRLEIYDRRVGFYRLEVH